MKIDYNCSTTEFHLYSGGKQWNLEEKPSCEMIWNCIFVFSSNLIIFFYTKNVLLSDNKYAFIYLFYLFKLKFFCSWPYNMFVQYSGVRAEPLPPGIIMYN
jgi:hypothetical protein